MNARLALIVLAAALRPVARADDCNHNGVDDALDIYTNCTSLDLDDSGVPDECEIAEGLLPDCNANGIVDWADIFGAGDVCGNPVGGGSADCDNNGEPDECQAAQDCNANGIPDPCEIRDNAERDDDGNGVPDSCDLAAGAPDCNANAVPDAADVRRRLGFDSSAYAFAGNTGAPAFPIDVALGDVDGDGDPDIVTANRAFPSGESLGVFRNQGDGTFSSGVISNTGGAAEAIVLADLDGDGDLDAAVAQRINSTFPVTIMLNDGTGAFSVGQNLSAGQVPIDVDAADIDHDGDTDLVVADINGGKVYVFKNNGHGVFTQISAIGVGSRPLVVKLAHLYDDNTVQMAVLVQTAAQLVLFNNNGYGLFTEATREDLGDLYAATGMSIRDMDGDGWNDIVLALQYSRSIAPMMNMHGSLTFLPTGGVCGPYAGNPVAVTTGDFDGDGVPDVATTLSPPWPNGPLAVGRGLGDGGLLSPTSFPAGYSALSLAAADLDGDGRDDIVSGIYQEKLIRVWLNRGLDALSADANHDGVPDECHCPADFDGTGFVDTEDFDAFVHAFELGGDDADFDHSGFVDTEDYDAFVHSFEAGC